MAEMLQGRSHPRKLLQRAEKEMKAGDGEREPLCVGGSMVIPALGEQRQVCESKCSLGYMARPCFKNKVKRASKMAQQAKVCKLGGPEFCP